TLSTRIRFSLSYLRVKFTKLLLEAVPSWPFVYFVTVTKSFSNTSLSPSESLPGGKSQLPWRAFSSSLRVGGSSPLPAKVPKPRTTSTTAHQFRPMLSSASAAELVLRARRRALIPCLGRAGAPEHRPFQPHPLVPVKHNPDRFGSRFLPHLFRVSLAPVLGAGDS